MGLSNKITPLHHSTFDRSIDFNLTRLFSVIMCFLRISEELSVDLNSHVECSSIFFIISQRFRLLSEALSLRRKAIFLRLQLSCVTTIAAEIDQAVVELKLEVK